MKHRNRRAALPIVAAFFLACISLTAQNALSAPGVKTDQPIHIVSDQAERNQKAGLITYIGKVVVTQGNMKILADKVVITMTATTNEVTKIVATGQPAEYHQTALTEEEKDVTAVAKTITYNVPQEELELLDSASISQSDGSKLAGHRINYDMLNDLIKAKSQNSDSGQPKKNGERIEMTIPAQTMKSEQDSKE